LDKSTARDRRRSRWRSHPGGIPYGAAPAASRPLSLIRASALSYMMLTTTMFVSHRQQGLSFEARPYGPAFQGLRAAWRRGEDLFAEAARTLTP
jgi:hypothetical protein